MYTWSGNRFDVRKLMRTCRTLCGRRHLVLYWYNRGEARYNWGDAINPYLVSRISGREVVNYGDVYKIPGIRVYSAAGSILDHLTTPNLYVWGSGFVDSRSGIRVRPKEVFAVRGPRTREKLIKLGVDCPEVYGDPALLISRMYNPAIRTRYKLGIIPHYAEKNEGVVNQIKHLSDVALIDITSDIFGFIKQVKRCERIASSSLHGLIVGDSYGIPSRWIRISGRIVGDDFKYHDYFESVGRKDTYALRLNERTSVEEILDGYYEYKVSIDLDKLLAHCPFRKG